jgi:hypothetical protein
MTRVRFEPFVKWFRGKMNGMVFRLSHNGQTSAYLSPDMSHVIWSKAQKDHRRDMKEAWIYASAAVADPDLRPIYVQMALENGKNPKRPFDMAVSDYCDTGNDLLWKKHMVTRRNQRTGTSNVMTGISRDERPPISGNENAVGKGYILVRP